MNVLVLNAGSSSLKYQLLDPDQRVVLASGLAERIGQTEGRLTHTSWPGTDKEVRQTLDGVLADQGQALDKAMACLTDPINGVLRRAGDIDAVGHRVVHGGERFSAPVRIDDDVIAGIRATAPLAPLHNPANLSGILFARTLFPDAPQVAVFDTAFHQTMPEKAFLYALPYELYEKYGIRKYGFHGTSHRYIARQAAVMLGKPLEHCDLITVHLGNGDSVCAIRQGRSIDTSMGMTPLAGTIMGTRSGDIDPQIGIYLAKQVGLTADEIDTMLNRHSGLLGICGASDMRDIHRRRAQGDARAELAFEMFAYSIRKYVGAYIAALGRVDAIVFTAGIGEHDPYTREVVIQGLEERGICLDAEKNRSATGQALAICTPDSPVKIFAIPTNEELEIAMQTLEVLHAGQ